MTTYATIDLTELTERFPHFPSAQEAPRSAHDDEKLWVLFMEKEVRRLMDADSFQQASAVNVYFFEAVNLLRAKQIEAARDRLDEGQRQAAALTHPHAHLYSRQYQLSAEALYHHKRQHHAQAFSLTVECIAINDYLVRLGCPSMLFRCLEQNINLSRVYNRQGDVAAERRLVNGLIRYLLFAESEAALWGTSFADFAPRLQSGYLHYVAEGTLKSYVTMAASLLIDTAARNPAAEQAHFTDLLGNIGEFATPTLERVVLYNWLYLKRAYLSGQTEAFVSEVGLFLEEPYERRFDVLKLSLCQNLLQWVRAQSAGYELLESRIQAYIDTKLIAKMSQKDYVLPGRTT